MTTLANFREALLNSNPLGFGADAEPLHKFKIHNQITDKLATYYAPFDYINHGARLILLGITPGRTQMNKALLTASQALQQGADDQTALKAAKREASFSGAMRKDFIELLNKTGVSAKFGLPCASVLWHPECETAHFTSVLRNPVFEGAMLTNYDGRKPALLGCGLLQPDELATELNAIPNGVILPLGASVVQVMQLLVNRGIIPLERVLNHAGVVAEFPHPSGQNGETVKLAKLSNLPDMQTYADTEWHNYSTSRKPKQTKDQYLSNRRSYWQRAANTKAAIAHLNG